MNALLQQFQHWDEWMTLAIQQWHNPLLDPVMIAITHLGTAGALWIASSIVLLIIPKTRRIGLVMAVSLALAAVVGNLVIKPWVARPRPFYTLSGVQMILPQPGGFSFPSGHTISSFAAAAALWFYSWKLALPATVVAGLIGFSRIYLFCHYPSDVFAGAILGIASAVLVGLVYKATLGRRWPIRKTNALRERR